MISYSIIIPCHFSSSFIGRLLDTVPLRDDIEVLLVDDSFDDEEYDALVKAVKDFPVKVFKNQDVKGVSGARNTGLRMANGRWGLFADSDDIFITENIQEIMNKYKDSDADEVVFRASSINMGTAEDSGRSDILDYYFSRYSNTFPRAAAIVMQNVVYTTIFKLDIVRKNHIRFQSYRMGEDALFMASVSRHSSKLVIENSVGYTIVDNAASVTRNLNYQLMYDWVITSAERNYEYNHFLTKEEVRIVRQTRFVIILKTLMALGPKAAIAINRHSSQRNLPYVKKDDLLYLMSKLKKAAI